MNSEPGQRNTVSYGSCSANLQYGGLSNFPVTLKTPIVHTGIVAGSGSTFPVNFPRLERGVSSLLNVQNELQPGYMSATVPVANMPTQFSALRSGTDQQNSCNVDRFSVNYKGLLDSIAPSQGTASLPSFGHFFTHFNQQQQQQQSQHHSVHGQAARPALNQNTFIQQNNCTSLPAHLMTCIQTQNSHCHVNNGKTGKDNNYLGCPVSVFQNTCLHTPSQTTENISEFCPVSLPTSTSQSLNQFPSKNCSMDIASSCNHITITTTTITTTTSSSFGSPKPAHVHSQAAIPTTMAGSQQPTKNNLRNSAVHQHNKKCGAQLLRHKALVDLPVCDLLTSADLQSLCAKKTLLLASNPNQVFHEVTVPFGWKRVIEEGMVVYYSPSNARLTSVQQVQDYLSTDGTCKCGLQCPVLVDRIFNFDIETRARQWTVNDVSCSEDLTKLCNHKRKIIAMATFQNSQTMPMGRQPGAVLTANRKSNVTDSSTGNKKDSKSRKKVKSKSAANPYDGVLVSQLLAERDKLKLAALNSSLLNATKSTAASFTPHSPATLDNLIHGPNAASLQLSKSPIFMNMQQNNVELLQQSDAQKEKKSFASDPCDDLGPITCHVPSKLDFSQEHQSSVMNLQGQTPFPALGIQPNPLTIQTVFPQDQLKNQLFLQPSPLTGHPAFGSFQNQHLQGAGVNFQVAGSTVLGMQQAAAAGGVFPQVNQANSMLFHMQTIGNQKFASPLLTNSALQGGVYSGTLPNHLYSPVNEVAWLDPGRNKTKRSRSKKERKRHHSSGERGIAPLVESHSLQSETSPSRVNAAASFLDNPTGYLAQQTALVNGSIASSQSLDAEDMLNSISELPATQDTLSVCKSAGKQWQQNQSVTCAVTNSTTSPENKTKTSGSSEVDNLKSEITGSASTVGQPSSNSCVQLSRMKAMGGEIAQHSDGDSASSPLPKVPFNLSVTCVVTTVAGQDVISSVTTISDKSNGKASSTSSISPSKRKSPSMSTSPDNKPLHSPTQKSKSVSKLKMRPNILSKASTSTSTNMTKIATVCQASAHFPLAQGISSVPNLSTSSIQQILNQQNTGDFPASNLLSAAARAQMAQQSPSQLNVLGQQVMVTQPLQLNVNLSPVTANLSLPSNVAPKGLMSCAIGSCLSIASGHNTSLLFQQAGTSPIDAIQTGLPHNLTAPTLASLPLNTITALGQPTAQVSLGNSLQTMLSGFENKTANQTQNSFKVSMPQTTTTTTAATTLDSSIGKTSEGHSGSKNCPELTSPHLVKGTVEELLDKGLTGLDSSLLPNVTQCVNPQLANLGMNLVNNQFPFVAMNTPMPPISLPVVTGVTNTLTQLIPAVGMSQPALNQQPIMQVVGTLGTPSAPSPMVITGSLTADGSMVGTSQQQMSTLPSQTSENVHDCLHQKITSPQLPSNTTTVSGVANCVKDTNGPVILGSAILPTVQKLSLNKVFPDSSNPTNNRTSSALSSKSDKNSQQMMSNLSQLSSAAAAAQLVLLPNLPLLQILNTGQLASGLSADYSKLNFPSTPLINQGVDLSTLLSPGQSTGLEGTTNFYGIPQGWGGLGNINLSMQLQAIQLQQQLLQFHNMHGLLTQLSQPEQQHTSPFVMDKQASVTTSGLTMENANDIGSPTNPGDELTGKVCPNKSMDAKVQQNSDCGVRDNDEDVDQEGGGQSDLSLENSEKHFCPDQYDQSSPESSKLSSPSSSSSLSLNMNYSGGNIQKIPRSLNLTKDLQSDDFSSSVTSSECLISSSSLSNIQNCTDQTVEDKAGLEPVSHEADSFYKDSSTEDGGMCNTVESCLKENLHPLMEESTPNNTSSTNLSLHKELSNTSCHYACGDHHLDYKLSQNLILKDRLSMPFKDYTAMEHQICTSSDETEKSLEDSLSTENCSSEESFSPLNSVELFSHEHVEDQQFHGRRNASKAWPSNMNRLSGSANVEIALGNIRQHNSRLDIETLARHSEKQNCHILKDSSPEQINQINYYGQLNHIDSTFSSSDTSFVDIPSHSEHVRRRGIKRIRDELKHSRDLFEDDDDSMEEPMIPSYPRTFNIGDLVWGQIRGFPSWPGKLVYETEVKSNHKTEAGKLWVEWFGDHTFTQVEPEKLKTLSEGLEAHHRARKKYRKGRKMNSHLEAAIQEAMMELDHQDVVEDGGKNCHLSKGRAVKKRKTR